MKQEAEAVEIGSSPFFGKVWMAGSRVGQDQSDFDHAWESSLGQPDHLWDQRNAEQGEQTYVVFVYDRRRRSGLR